MAPKLPLDQLAEQLSFLFKELKISGQSLVPALKRPVEALKSGRAPRIMDLRGQLQEGEDWLKVLDEILVETLGLLPGLREYFETLERNNPSSPDVKNLAAQVSGLEKEAYFWKALSERSWALVKKLRLIVDQEKLSPLARNPIQDAWDEVERLAK